MTEIMEFNKPLGCYSDIPQDIKFLFNDLDIAINKGDIPSCELYISNIISFSSLLSAAFVEGKKEISAFRFLITRVISTFPNTLAFNRLKNKLYECIDELDNRFEITPYSFRDDPNDRLMKISIDRDTYLLFKKRLALLKNESSYATKMIECGSSNSYFFEIYKQQLDFVIDKYDGYVTDFESAGYSSDTVILYSDGITEENMRDEQGQILDEDIKALLILKQRTNDFDDLLSQTEEYQREFKQKQIIEIMISSLKTLLEKNIFSDEKVEEINKMISKLNDIKIEKEKKFLRKSCEKSNTNYFVDASGIPIFSSEQTHVTLPQERYDYKYDETHEILDRIIIFNQNSDLAYFTSLVDSFISRGENLSFIQDFLYQLFPTSWDGLTREDISSYIGILKSLFEVQLDEKNETNAELFNELVSMIDDGASAPKRAA